MTIPKPLRRFLCAGLAVCLVSMPVRATEPTVPPDTIPTEPLIAESTAPTEPATTAYTEQMTLSTGNPPPSEPEPTAAAETIPPETEVPALTSAEEIPFSCPYNLYFGLLHAHSNISDGAGTVKEAFTYASAVKGLDFFALTDHSDSFDNASSGAIGSGGAAISEEWAAGKAAAAAVTDEDFLGIFGYEMSWQRGKNIGHICTFHTPGWVSRDQKPFENPAHGLEAYYEALTTVPDSVSQFCHPGPFYGEFEDFAHCTPEYDNQMHLLEVGGEGDLDVFDCYDKALKAGWHIAPSWNQNNHDGRWGDESDVRTVVLADSLTEEGLFTAIRDHRVYATQDKDLHIYYTLDGHSMGSILSYADDPEITVALYDPTDESIGTVEVVCETGVLTKETVAGNAETLTLPVSGTNRWYYLRITQPDGDLAVTAPVWVEGYEDFGIAAFESDTSVPVQGQPLELTLTLFNEETLAFSLERVEFFIGDTLIHRVEAPGTIAAQSDYPYSFFYTHPDAGTAVLRAEVRGTIGGQEHRFEADLTLRFRTREMVTGLLVDGSHCNMGLEALKNLAALAAEADMAVTVFTGEMPLGGELLLVTAPGEVLADTFVADTADFVKNGGSLILCGGPGGSPQLNRLLEAAEVSLRLNADLLEPGSTDQCNPESPYCEGITDEQFFVCEGSCTIDPGSGTWLVKSGEHILLACEETAYGGTVFTAGSLFLSDVEMPQQENLWDPPRISRTIAETVLGIRRTVIPVSCIETARSGSPGELFRVTGYVTAGTSKAKLRFPNTLYLQDDTGGIAVKPFSEAGIQTGAPMEVAGILREEEGNLLLDPIGYRVLEESYYRWVPRTISCSAAMNYAARGGELLQVEGTVTGLKTEGDRITRLVIEDFRGGEAVIEIEQDNTLATDIRKGRTARAMGILHINSAGETVLRVRNPEEVVYVPPKADPTNPKTGDILGWLEYKWKELQF